MLNHLTSQYQFQHNTRVLLASPHACSFLYGLITKRGRYAPLIQQKKSRFDIVEEIKCRKSKRKNKKITSTLKRKVVYVDRLRTRFK